MFKTSRRFLLSLSIINKYYNTPKRSGLIYSTIARHEWHGRHECKMRAPLVTRVWRAKHFHTLVFTIWQMKTIRRLTISFQELLFGNVSFPCQNAFKKCTTKTKLFNGKCYVNKLYTRSKLQMLLHVPA